MTIRRKLFVCRTADIPQGTSVSFRYGVSNGIAYNDDGVIKAYVNRCTHMGGSVSLVPEHGVFRCVRHHAEFDPKTGQRLSGQAPEGTSLTPVPLVFENDQIFAVLELKEDFE